MTWAKKKTEKPKAKPRIEGGVERAEISKKGRSCSVAMALFFSVQHQIFNPIKLGEHGSNFILSGEPWQFF